MTNRVAWATGPVGRHAIAAVAEHGPGRRQPGRRAGRHLPDVVRRLEEACAAGGTSFHATGIEPDWGSEVLPLAISGLLKHADSILVQEILDYASYDNSFMLFGVMGFGHAPESQAFFAAEPGIRTFRDLPNITGRHVLRTPSKES